MILAFTRTSMETDKYISDRDHIIKSASARLAQEDQPGDHMRQPPVTSSAAPVTKELDVGEQRNLMASATSRG